MSMCVDDRTSKLNLPLPHVRNDMTVDCARLREALGRIDTAVGAQTDNIASLDASMSETSKKLSAAQGAADAAQGAADAAAHAAGVADDKAVQPRLPPMRPSRPLPMRQRGRQLFLARLLSAFVRKLQRVAQPTSRWLRQPSCFWVGQLQHTTSLLTTPPLWTLRLQIMLPPTHLRRENQLGVP